MTDWMHYSVDGQAGPPSTVGKLYVEIAKMEMPHEAKAHWFPPVVHTYY